MKKKISKSCIILLVWMIVTLIVVSVRAIQTRNDSDSTYFFNVLQSLAIIVALLIPYFLLVKFNIVISVKLELIYQAIIVLCLLCGEVYNFFGLFPWWDTLMHFSTGVLIGLLWFIIVNTLCKYHKNNIKLPFAFTAITGICFALGLGVIWEIFEYAMDGWFGMNMQQFRIGKGTFDKSNELVGHAALTDTMKDLILATVGSTLTVIVAYFRIKMSDKTIFLESFLIYESDKILEQNEQTQLDKVI